MTVSSLLALGEDRVCCEAVVESVVHNYCTWTALDSVGSLAEDDSDSVGVRAVYRVSESVIDFGRLLASSAVYGMVGCTSVVSGPV